MRAAHRPGTGCPRPSVLARVTTCAMTPRLARSSAHRQLRRPAAVGVHAAGSVPALRSAPAAAWPRRRAAPSWLCRARRKRAPSDEDDEEDDDDDEERPRRAAAEELDDDGNSHASKQPRRRRRSASPFPEDEEVDADPTTRLFRRASDDTYEDDEEEEDEEEEEEIEEADEEAEEGDDELGGLSGFPPGAEGTTKRKRGRPPRAAAAADGAGKSLAAEVGDEVDLDAMIDAFESDLLEEDPEEEEEEEDEEAGERLPSRATQSRPAEMSEELLEAGLEEADLEDEEEGDGMGPSPNYPEPPERKYQLRDLLEMCGYEVPENGLGDVEITGIKNDAIQVQEGDLYVAAANVGYDGHFFIAEALERGAAAIVGCGEVEDAEVPVIVVPDALEALSRLAAAFYSHPSRKMAVVGVTGSRGKSTTAWLVRGVFEEMGQVTGLLDSLEHAIGVDKLTPLGDLWEPETEDPTLQRECSTAFHVTPYVGKYPAPGHTPDSLGVQRSMAGMADRGATACVYEIDLPAASANWCRGVELDVAVYMGLSDEDLEAADGPEELLQEQWHVFGALKDPLKQTAVVNMDDPYYEQILEFAKAVPTVTFSVTNQEADVYVERAVMNVWETEAVIATPAGRLSLSSTLIGRHNLANLLAAVATGLALTIEGEGIPLKAIVQGIEATEVIPGRCELIDEDQDFSVVVDAADTPESLSRLLDSVRETGPRRIILVLGCEGERDQLARPFMGEIAHWKADVVILTNDNPRGERPQNIIADIVAGFPDEILELNARQPYSAGFLQDPGRIPMEALEFSWHYCFEFSRYVCEDRWTALRWAIGTAQKKDIVVIAGKGHEDFQEWDLGAGIFRSWFDDRVEARNALSKLSRRLGKGELDRKELPWMEAEERPDHPRVFNVDDGTADKELQEA